MRRKYLATVVFTLPLANAFSLASFQPITSGLIPAGCALSYNSPIAGCDTDDFSTGCSKACKRGLQNTETNVQTACSGLIVNSRSLLGIVQAGGILAALCVKGDEKTSTTSVRTSTSQIPIIILPTSVRPTVQPTTAIAPPSTTLQTSPRPTTQPTTGIALPSSTVQTSTQTTSISSITQIIIGPTTAVLIPTNGIGLPPIPDRSSSTISTSTTSASTTTNRPAVGAGAGTGGGSPFDIVNTSGASYLATNPLITAMVLGGWAFMLVRR